MKKEKQIYKLMRVFRIIRSVLLTVAVIALCAVLIHTLISRISGKTPSVFGYSIFRVSSGSMRPELEIGDVILVKECDPLTVNEGDIVTYNGTSGEMAGKIVTHRVIKAPFERDGETYILTQGDANSGADPDVNINQILGTVQTKLGFMTHIYNLFATPWGLLIVGIGYEEEKGESVEEIIERYQKENAEKAKNEEENQ